MNEIVNFIELILFGNVSIACSHLFAGSAADMYKVSVQSNTYVLNVCGNLATVGCSADEPSEYVSACQWTSTANHTLGSLNQSVLMYADNRLSLTYSGGEPCHHSHFQRMTVINFFCNQTAGAFPILFKC